MLTGYFNHPQKQTIMIRNKDISEDYSDGYHNGFKMGKINGYTTSNDEVIKMLREELTETENKIALENNTFYEVGSLMAIVSDNVKTVMTYHAIRIEKLLTKLKEDKK